MNKIGMMATYPARKNSLLEMLPTVVGQLDTLYIYCNQYTQEALMNLHHWSMEHSNGCVIKLIHGGDEEGDVRDMGKFWALGTVEGYVFLLDDDIRYPPDYCRRMLNAINLHQGIITVHGRIIRNYPLDNYYKDTESKHYRFALNSPHQVDIAGTGTCGFCTKHLPSGFYASKLAMEQYQGMADIWFACRARLYDISITCMSRRANWLQDTPSASQSSSLYQEAKKDDNKICLTLNQIQWHD